MNCTSCGSEAVVKRGETYFCGKCAINADWQQVIASIQDAVVETPVAGAAQSA
jgi:hypothetical protein